jgi:hypothetical protein
MTAMAADRRPENLEPAEHLSNENQGQARRGVSQVLPPFPNLPDLLTRLTNSGLKILTHAADFPRKSLDCCGELFHSRRLRGCFSSPKESMRDFICDRRLQISGRHNCEQ